MRIRSPFQCDYCLNLKGETNHWWLHPPDANQFVLLVWDVDLANHDEYEHICSESCASKALSKWMAGQVATISHPPAIGGKSQILLGKEQP